MSTIDGAQDNSPSTPGTLANNAPVDQDDNPILWDNLLATVDGTLTEGFHDSCYLLTETLLTPFPALLPSDGNRVLYASLTSP